MVLWNCSLNQEKEPVSTASAYTINPSKTEHARHVSSTVDELLPVVRGSIDAVTLFSLHKDYLGL